MNHLNRRTFVKLAGVAVAGSSFVYGQGESQAAISLFNGQNLEGWIDVEKSASTGWIVKDGAIASTGAGCGVLYTANDYSRFRLMFTMRHVSGQPDHQACGLIFCTRPQPGEKPLDALGGIQLQVPKGGHWDYRLEKNNSGGPEFTTITKPQLDVHAWGRVENWRMLPRERLAWRRSAARK